MGLLGDLTEAVGLQLSNRSLGVTLASGFAAFAVLAIVLNVLKQLLLKNPNEPPIVFHWVPFIGSTITYGIDPYRFFFDCRRKVPLCATGIVVYS
jgi:sterol 14-demethylase